MTATDTPATMEAVDQDLTPFEAELRRYEAGQITRDDLVSWLAGHQWKPLRIDPMEDIAVAQSQPGTVEDVYEAFHDGRIDLDLIAAVEALSEATTKA
ncbi:DUF4339 domain-containing protein (plasmid) [Iamia sp. SCSIO 61187]|uniref:hypothetical protein n=1 Tax=Iamia sp. SCSIO 61187 TaxID=2722752 RepID=UPI001C632991|nr:hypothetical protein [Iamia sp. SCSIO 61187]QYG95837.1 DUF4339 domain-containing protein [Iamia sp. SCSIO 61187]